MLAVGVDIGGTFTDLIAYDPESGGLREAKVLSTPAEPTDALTVRDHADGGHRPPGWQPRWEWDAAALEEELVRDPANTRTWRRTLELFGL